MKTQEKQLNMLGLAQRAGKLISGDERVETAVKNKQAKLIVMANDASDATKKRYRQWSTEYAIPLDMSFNRQAISHAIGRTRSLCAIVDSGMAKTYLSYLTRNEATYDNY